MSFRSLKGALCDFVGAQSGLSQGSVKAPSGLRPWPPDEPKSRAVCQEQVEQQAP